MYKSLPLSPAPRVVAFEGVDCSLCLFGWSGYFWFYGTELESFLYWNKNTKKENSSILTQPKLLHLISQASEFTETEWEAEGLFQPKPRYADGKNLNLSWRTLSQPHYTYVLFRF